MTSKLAALLVGASILMSGAALAQGTGAGGGANSGNGSPNAAPQADQSTGPTRPAPQPSTTSSGQGGNNSPDRGGTSVEQPSSTPRGSGAGSNTK
jgi:hypothetical protein